MLIDDEKDFWKQAINLLLLPIRNLNETWLIEEIKAVYAQYEESRGLSILFYFRGRL